jgi:hypothetical protein
MNLQFCLIRFRFAVKTRVLRPRLLFLTRMLTLNLLFAAVVPASSHAGNVCGVWSTVQKWQVKMHLTQIKGKTGVLQSGPDCTANYVLALNHVSDVNSELPGSGTPCLYQGNLTSQETINNKMDIPFTGRAECSYGDVSFTEIGTGAGSQNGYQLIIDPSAGKYTIAFPHTGVTTPFNYIAWAGGYSGTLFKEINGDFIIDYPSMVLAENPTDPVTTLQFSLPGSTPQKITGETTFYHYKYPEIPITWSWELTPDFGGTSSQRLSVTIQGSYGGGGSVTSDPTGIACSSGTCTADYTSGTQVGLIPAADSNSAFTGWSGDCSGTGNCSVGMIANRSATASFGLIPRARVAGIPYGSLISGYAAVSDGGVLEAQALVFVEDLSLAMNPGKIFSFKGGYANDYLSRIGYTTLDGKLTIGIGALTIDQLIIK